MSSSALAAGAEQPTEHAALPQRWCIITCEYPPMVGGVSDHTQLLAEALAKTGDAVDVWTPPLGSPPPESPGVEVHQLPSFFHLDALLVLRRVLQAQTRDTRILVQYVPTGYGWRMMNVAFALLLYSQRTRGLDLYFHEVGFKFSEEVRLRRKIAALVHLVMNWLSIRAAARVFVAIHEWRRRLQKLGVPVGHQARSVLWVPVPSNVPDVVDAESVGHVRDAILTGHDRTAKIVGHFGTFGRYHSALLLSLVPKVLDDGSDRVFLLVGRNSLGMRRSILGERPDLSGRVVATGGIDAAGVSTHLAACDVLVQPYEDGASARRGSLMAGLALGRAVVSNSGGATGDIWTERSALHLCPSDTPTSLASGVTALLQHVELRERLGESARQLHRDTFAIGRGVDRLRNAAPYQLSTTGQFAAGPPLHVLMLHTTLPTPGRKPGGVEIAVHRLANALVTQGVSVDVGSLSDEAPPDARYAHRKLFRASAWLRDSRIGRLLVLPVLLNGIRLGNANVVHFHGDDWFVFRRSRATVRTLHGSALREAQRATRWQRRLVQYGVYPLERLAARLATVTVAVGLDAAHIHGISRVIGNGVDPVVFHPGEKHPRPMLLYVGTRDGRKRGQWMYDLFVNEIAKRHPTVYLHFLSDHEPPPHPRVVFDRFPTDALLAQAYREAWVFALPSTYEGFGIPYLEAMASGTAVVATPNSGARELLQDGKYGVLAEDREFADTVLALLEDTARRRTLEMAGLSRAQQFTWDAIARSYTSLYREALALHDPVAAGVR